MSFVCQYCEKTFTLHGNLLKHQKTTKYCIKIQQEQGEKNISNDIMFSCEYCNKEFTTKNNINRHYKTCVQKYKKLLEISENNNSQKEQRIEDLKAKNRDLENQIKIIRLEVERQMYKDLSEKTCNTIEEIAKQPRNQVNNNQKVLITSAIDLSQEKMKDMIDNSFNANYMIQGQKGVAKFAYDTMLKDEEGRLKYICTDPSRQIFQYKNGEGEVQKDVKAKKLTKALLDGELKSASHKIASDKMKDNAEDFLEYSTYYLDIKELEDDNSDFSKELSTLVI